MRFKATKPLMITTTAAIALTVTLGFQNCSENIPTATGGQSSLGSLTAPPATQPTADPGVTTPPPDAGTPTPPPDTTPPPPPPPPAPVVDESTPAGFMQVHNGKVMGVGFWAGSEYYNYGVKIAISSNGYQVSIARRLRCDWANCYHEPTVVFPERTLSHIGNGQDISAYDSVYRTNQALSKFVRLERDSVANKLYFSITRPYCLNTTFYRADVRTDGGNTLRGALAQLTNLPGALNSTLGYQAMYPWNTATQMYGGCIADPVVDWGGGGP